MAKFCSNCGKELKENADICLNCGFSVVNDVKSTNVSKTNNNTDNQKKGLPWWAILLIILGAGLLLFVILIFCFGLFAYNSVRRVPVNELNKYIEEFEDAASNFEENVENYIDEYNENTTIIEKGTVGDTLEIDGIKFTLTETKTYLDDNNRYLVFFLTVENNSSTEKLVSYLNFKLVIEDKEELADLLLDEIDGANILNRNIKVGEKTKGYIAFKVDDNFGKAELHYQRYITNNKIVFTITNESV